MEYLFDGDQRQDGVSVRLQCENARTINIRGPHGDIAIQLAVLCIIALAPTFSFDQSR